MSQISNYHSTVSTSSTLMIVLSSISTAAALSVIVAFFSAPNLRKFLFSGSTHDVIFWVTLSNMLSSLGSSMGEAPNGTAACYFQGLATNVFSLSSFYWVTYITYMLYVIVVLGRAPTVTWSAHIICWGVPLLATFLPFIDVTYGNDDTSPGWCFIQGLDGSGGGASDDANQAFLKTMWYWLSYYVHVWLCIFAILVLAIRTYHAIRHEHKSSSQPILMSIFRQLLYYPPIIVFCWLYTTFYDCYILGLSDYEQPLGLKALAESIPCLQGTLMAGVFWVSLGRSTWNSFVKKSLRKSSAIITSSRVKFSSVTTSSRRVDHIDNMDNVDNIDNIDNVDNIDLKEHNEHNDNIEDLENNYHSNPNPKRSPKPNRNPSTTLYSKSDDPVHIPITIPNNSSISIEGKIDVTNTTEGSVTDTSSSSLLSSSSSSSYSSFIQSIPLQSISISNAKVLPVDG